jgi:hypothetical protein
METYNENGKTLVEIRGHEFEVTLATREMLYDLEEAEDIYDAADNWKVVELNDKKFLIVIDRAYWDDYEETFVHELNEDEAGLLKAKEIKTVTNLEEESLHTYAVVNYGKSEQALFEAYPKKGESYEDLIKRLIHQREVEIAILKESL